MTADGHRPARALFGTVALIAITVVSFVAAAWVADRLTAQDDEITAAPMDDPVVVPAPGSTTDEGGDAGATSSDPGAIEAVDDGGAPVEGMPGGAWMLPVELVDQDTDAETDTGGTDQQGSGEDQAAPPPVPTAEAPIPAGQAVAMAELLGSTSLTPPPVTTRFVDLCTELRPACPIGQAATVVPLSGDVQPPTLAIRIWPAMTKAVFPAMRCEPGYPSPAKLPVLVTSNRPLDELDVTLELPDGTTLHKIDTETPASEVSWFWNLQSSGQGTGTDLTNGVQHCATLAALGDPTVAFALPNGTVLPSPLTYRVRARARAADDTVEAVAEVSGDALATTGARPPTMLQPLSGNVVQVGVPEIDPRLDRRPTAWVVNATYWQDKVGLGTAASICAKPPPGTPDPGFYDPPKTLLVPLPQQYDPGQLDQPTYPYDRNFTHYSVWNAVLVEGSTYALCVSWPLESGEVREAWTLETPNGLQFSFANMVLSPKESSPYTTWYLRADASACYVTFPPSVHGGSLCPSSGLPYPAITTFTHTGTYPKPYMGTGMITDDLGSTRLRTPTWCTDIADLSALELIVEAANATSLLGQCLARSTQIASAKEVTMVFADPNVLCGSDSCLEEHRFGTVRTTASIGEGTSNGRSRDPLDWGIQGPVGL